MKKIILILLLSTVAGCTIQGQSDSEQKEIIYGRKDGMALTMLMLKPTGKSNHRAIISMVSGGWYSQASWIPDMIKTSGIFMQRGYTVFLVMHSGRPMFTIQDAIADAKRSVRFIRFHAREYNIDPDHIGITGTSSGGHLSLCVGTNDDDIIKNTNDPVDGMSGRVQAVACFYPPSDFLNWGETHVDPKNKSVLDEADVYSAFYFKHWDPVHKYYAPLNNDDSLMIIYKAISPIYHLSTDDPPILIAHGTADDVVPISQSEKFMEKYKSIKGNGELMIKKNAKHGGWSDEYTYENYFADWFDKYLL